MAQLVKYLALYTKDFLFSAQDFTVAGVVGGWFVVSAIAQNNCLQWQYTGEMREARMGATI